MKKLFLFLIVLAGLAVIGYLTNPTEAMHREAGKEKLEKIMENTLMRYGVGKNILSSLGIDPGKKYVGQMIDSHISIDNYYVFSLTRLKWEDKSYVIGVGIFNKVFISNKVDDIAAKTIDDFLKDESPLINAIFQKVEKLIISGFLFVSFFASNIVTIICIL